MEKNKTLCLIDANSLLYRAFHALPSLTTPTGEPIGAVYGFTSMLMRVIEELNPTHLAVAWDMSGPTFRHKAYTAYKEHRPETPEELLSQKDKVQKLLDVFPFKQFGVEGYEADDLIGTLATKAGLDGFRVLIVTGDMDALQLVNNEISVYTAKGGGLNETIVYDPDAVRVRLGGLGPEQVVDYKALRGDPSDNIPGVKGIGEKTAVELLTKYTTLDGVYEHLDDLTERQKKLLTEGREMAYLSQNLARIDCNAPIDIVWEEIVVLPFNRDNVLSLFREYGFKSLVARFDGVGKAYQQQDLGFVEAKTDKVDLAKTGVVDPTSFDIYIAAYLLTGATGNQLTLESLAFEQLGLVIKESELTPEERQSVIFQLSEKFSQEFNATGNEKLRSLFENVEMPLRKVLIDMHERGVLVNIDTVRQLSEEYKKNITELEQQIYRLVGFEFNLNSPKQLEQVLFDQLQLPVIKKTKTQRSTDESVLLKLREMHPMLDVLLKYRQLHKIKSTYLDPLPALLDDNNRVHTTFNQTKAASGRLSSENPNLQNIPLDPETGLRRLFKAPEGKTLVIADYSQIELRLMAHLSQEPRLIASFTTSQDVHAATAARIFDKLIDDVTKMERQVGKTINFALMYGITSHGLSEQLGIDRVKADLYISNFYKNYPKVKEWQEKLLAKAREEGFVETMYGRRRYLPELSTRNFHLRAASERIAINHPLQGSQADIIKIAMIRISDRLASLGLKDDNYMILQIHDELVLEVEDKHVDEVSRLVKDEMEGVVELSVPIQAELKTGKNWQDTQKVVV